MLFDKKLLEKLIDEKYTNCVLVNKEIKAPEKDFKAVIKNNRVVKIGVSDFLYWLDEIEKFIEKGEVKRYAEDAFNKISDKIVLRPLYFNDELCMEIDTMEDLNIARNIIGDTQ